MGNASGKIFKNELRSQLFNVLLLLVSPLMHSIQSNLNFPFVFNEFDCNLNYKWMNTNFESTILITQSICKDIKRNVILGYINNIPVKKLFRRKVWYLLSIIPLEH